MSSLLNSFSEGAKAAQERAKELAKQAEKAASEASKKVESASAAAYASAAGVAGSPAPAAGKVGKRTLESLGKEELLLLIQREMESGKKHKAAAEKSAAAAKDAVSAAAAVKGAAIALAPASEQARLRPLWGEALATALPSLYGISGDAAVAALRGRHYYFPHAASLQFVRMPSSEGKERGR